MFIKILLLILKFLNGLHFDSEDGSNINFLVIIVNINVNNYLVNCLYSFNPFPIIFTVMFSSCVCK